MTPNGSRAREGQANLIGGAWRAAESGESREVRAALAPFAVLGRWPSSGAPDAEHALEALAEGARGWGEVPAEVRAERLRAARNALAQDEQAFALVARRTGLVEGELADERARLAEASLEPAPGSAERPIAWCASDWSELLAGTFRRAAGELLRGAAAGLLADPRLPMAADAVARACLAGGVPAGALAVLHGANEEALERALADGRVGSVTASGGSERIAALRAGTSRAGTPRVALELLRSSAREIDPEEDLERAVAEVIERAFGRASALSGQRGGQLGRVFCPARRFARFSAALLQRLEQSAAVREPLPLIDRAALERVRTRWASGLDEGATLVFGGKERPRAEAGSDLVVQPTLFTNVEASMGIALRQDPLPVLCLLRAGPARGGV